MTEVFWEVSYPSQDFPPGKTNHLKEYGLRNGKVQIAHCRNEEAVQTLKNMIAAELSNVTVKICKNLGLCSYYAERGALLVGY